jgi:small subunit ribosomal protein S4
LFLKGERCYSDKCAFSRRGYAPGQHGAGQGRKKVSEYGLQLREKQKARRIYGVLECQFRNYFEKAERQKGITGEKLLGLLERRLDNLVYRMGFASSRTQARQLVMHGHFEVGGHRVDIPSYLVRSGEVIKVCEKSKESPLIQGIAQELAHKTIPIWLNVVVNDMSGTLVRYPSREEMDVSIQEHLIVELYSR